MIPLENDEPTCGQLYIYDDEISINKRLKTNEKLTKYHLVILTNIMNYNPYTKNFRSLNQLANVQNLPKYRLYFIRKNDKQKHRYNKPLTAECGAIIVSKSLIPDDFDLCIYPKSKPNSEHKRIYLNKLSHHVDPMVFPLFFPSGDLGWSIGYSKKPDSKSKQIYDVDDLITDEEKKNSKRNLENLTILQYYAYRLSYRPNIKDFSPLLFGGKLTQQYFLQALIMVESNRMNFFRNNQKQLRIECYQGLYDHVFNSASNNSQNF